MKKPTIISMIKINDEWINQNDVPPDIVRQIVAQTIIRAAANIGFEVARKEKTA